MDVTLRFTKSWLESPDVGWLCTFTRPKKVENCRKEQCNCCKFSPCMLTSISFPVVSCHSVPCSMNHLYNCLFFFVSLVGAHCSLRSFNLWLWGLSLTVGDVEIWRSSVGRSSLSMSTFKFRTNPVLETKTLFFPHFGRALTFASARGVAAAVAVFLSAAAALGLASAVAFAALGAAFSWHGWNSFRWKTDSNPSNEIQ